VAPTGAVKPAATSNDPLPAYIAFTGGPKPDYHDPQPIFADGFDAYPASPFKANDSAPGLGGTINVLITEPSSRRPWLRKTCRT
jgi:hypothetical protein